MRRHRACVLLRGSPTETHARAALYLREIAPDQQLWVVGGGSEVEAEIEGGAREVCRTEELRQRLGKSYDAVVLDLHAGLRADVLGQSQGLVRGGGAVVLRAGPPGSRLTRAEEMMNVPPFTAADIAMRFEARLERVFGACPAPTAALAPAPRIETGTDEQAALVESLAGIIDADAPACAVVLARRGRGKSSALGLALSRSARLEPGGCVVAAASRDAAGEVLHFGPTGLAAATPLALALGEGPAEPRVIVVDEAAQVPVPVLRALAERHASSTLLFATTTEGYEGTGRGFVLRFLRWLEEQPRPLHRYELRAPIRWAEGDPVEAMCYDALLLDAAPVPLEVVDGPIEAAELDRDALAADEGTLHDVLGILVGSHYRTTPDDLHRILDAPNMRLHALRVGGRVVAVTLLALEGGLSPEESEHLSWGRITIRGHAMAENIVAHLHHPEGGPLTMVRSVRIASHPGLRRRGLASQLVEHVHASYAPDLFGTLFGATADLLAFRHAVDYAVCRVSASRGARSGEPAVMMCRPVSEAGHRLVAALRQDAARDLPAQVERLEREGGLLMDPRLKARLLHELPPVVPRSDDERQAVVRSYAFGRRTYEAVAGELEPWLLASSGLATLEDWERTLVAARVEAGLDWHQSAARADLPTARTAMRRMRPIVRKLLAVAGDSAP